MSDKPPPGGVVYERDGRVSLIYFGGYGYSGRGSCLLFQEYGLSCGNGGGYEMRSIKTFGPTVIHLIKMRLCFRITCERARSQGSRFRALKPGVLRERARSRVPLECLLNTSLPRRLYTLHVVSILSKTFCWEGANCCARRPPAFPLGSCEPGAAYLRQSSPAPRGFTGKLGTLLNDSLSTKKGSLLL